MGNQQDPSVNVLRKHRAPSYGNTLNEARKEALAEADNARFSRFHVRVCLVAGVGFFTDAYDIFAVSPGCSNLRYS